MIILYSLEWEKGKWSWGNIVKSLLKELEYIFDEIISVDYKSWRTSRGGDKVIIKKDKNSFFLSQNVKQLEKLGRYSSGAYDKTICRLGGLRSFQISPLRSKNYLQRMSKCFAIVATNDKLKIIAELVNDRVYLIPNGLDLEKWVCMEKPFSHNLSNMVVGFVGNIKTKEKCDYKGYNIIEDTCNMLGLELKTALFGPDQIPHEEMQEKFYKEIDVLVLLTDGEGCSNTIMESLACGIPVITTREAGYHGEKLSHEINVLFSEKNRKDLKDQLKKLQQRPALYKKISENGRLFTEEHHNVKRVAQEYREVFKSCVDIDTNKSYKEKMVTTRKTMKKNKNSIRDDEIEYKDTTIVTIFDDERFDKRYVINLYNMLCRNIKYPFKFVCMIDDSINLPEIKGIEFQIIDDLLSSRWYKVDLFKPGRFESERVLYLDLDTIVMDNVDDLLSVDYTFSSLKPWNKTNQNIGLINTGIMSWENKKCTFIYKNFSEEVMDEYPDAQTYISEEIRKNNNEYVPIQDFFPGIYSFKKSCKSRLPAEDAKIICFYGKPLIHKCKKEWIGRFWK